MSWKIEHPAGCSRLVYTADSVSELIGYQWDQILRGQMPGFHPVGLIRNRDDALCLVADFSCTLALSEVDDAQDRKPAKGVQRLRQIVEVLQFAVDCLFDEHQAILDSEAVRFPVGLNETNAGALLVILPCVIECTNTNKPAASLIVQIASAYGWSASYANAVTFVYEQSGLEALEQFLLAYPDGESTPSAANLPTSECILTELTRDSNPHSEDAPQMQVGQPVRKGKHVAFAAWIGLHAMLAAAAFLHRPQIGRAHV